MEDRYTDGVKNAWKFAAQEAAKLGSDYIGTEHLLIGIAHEGDSAGGKILNSLGITVGTLEELFVRQQKYIPVPEIRTVCCTAYKTRTGDGCRRSQ